MNNEEKILSALETLTATVIQMDGRLDKLEQGQAKLEQGQAKLEQGQARLEAKIKDIDLNIKALWEDIKRGDLRLDRHEREYHRYG